ncbi:hypothetical protein Rhow_006890 [Rhodococcus wratislaviensis]|uniref:Uncharacterized protein n=1 Tax=Rhodococcus wratislaviensis TaxID=44752 RepID=A0A402CGM5_RHOWR|nr:hypothetical protein [Rhodococcus wratislaviensis]GCE42761.1 hypothetical protein Rhow_006890 [Rhodococcus wratislaviensis]
MASELDHIEYVIRNNNGQRMDDELTELWTQLVAASDAISEYRDVYHQALDKGLRWPRKRGRRKPPLEVAPNR